MKLDKILAITGHPGLFQLLAQTRNGMIATSLIDGKKVVKNTGDKISFLSDIQVFGLKGEVLLSEIFEKILNYEEGKSTRIDFKAPAKELKTYFSEVFQEYDEDRVYPSDIKKIVQWYNLLLDKRILEAPKKENTELEDLPENKNENEH